MLLHWIILEKNYDILFHVFFVLFFLCYTTRTSIIIYRKKKILKVRRILRVLIRVKTKMLFPRTKAISHNLTKLREISFSRNWCKIILNPFEDDAHVCLASMYFINLPCSHLRNNKQYTILMPPFERIYACLAGLNSYGLAD